MVGSSCNNAETGVLAPTTSPACTFNVFDFVFHDRVNKPLSTRFPASLLLIFTVSSCP